MNNTMKFKVGDKVKCIDWHGRGEKNGGCGWDKGLIFTVTSVAEYHSGDCCFGGKNSNGVYQDYLELITNKPKIMKLNTMMKKLLDKNVRTLIKADYINGDLEFTVEGNKALTSILFEANKEELVKLAKEVIEECKEK